MSPSIRAIEIKGIVKGIGLCLLLCSISACHKKTSTGETAGPSPALAGEFRARQLRDIKFDRTPARLERGKYLSEGLLQCFICHSDRDWKAPGGPPLQNKKGAGHVWEDRPWLVAPNITPDEKTGAGTWTDDMFVRAIREGIGHDGRILHPQMWYGPFRSLSDEDVASIVVYLRALAPISNPLPATKIPDERKKTLMAPPPLTEAVAQPDLSTPVRRGAYLVRVADCAGCHTAWEAPLVPGFFGGGNEIELWNQPKVFSPNLTPDSTGISYYDDALFRQVLRTGLVKARKLSPVMPWIVFRNLNDDDMNAIFAYFRSRRPVHHIVDNAEPPTMCPMCGQKHGFGDRNHPKIGETVRVDPKTFDAYVGEYKFDDGFTLDISREGDKLLIQFEGAGPKLELVAISENEFTATEIPDVISFVKDSQGRVTHLIDNSDEIGKKIR
jgi:mono/diheme cytochrome c family protein